MIRLYCLSGIWVLFLAGVFAFVQAGIAQDQVQANDIADAPVLSDDLQSLVFTYWEYEALQEAKYSRGLARAPTDAELMRDLERGLYPEEEKVKPPPEKRNISLGGLVYKNDKDWTIWLNGQRLTPQAVPKEVIDLRVYEQYIELKWYDEYTNKIYPVRLRPHQRFNIDTRIFLAG